MTDGHRTAAAHAAKVLLAGVFIAGNALAMASQATADPILPVPTPVPGAPDAAAAAAPGQPVVEDPNTPAPDGAVAAPAPPPVGPPVVPEIANPQYGTGSSGPLGFLKDAWNQAKNPYDMTGPDGQPISSAPPPGAGAAPPLPPGFVSMNAPGSETASTAAPPNSGGGPALPPGYYPVTGPPPPGYDAAAPVPAVPPAEAPILPTP